MNQLRHFFSRWQNWLGLLIVYFFIYVAVVAPILSPQDPKNPGVIKIVGKIYDYTHLPPSEAAPLGTMSKGVSVFHALVWGTRSALIFGLTVALISMAIGVFVGTVSAYKGGFLNNFLMRVSDSFLAFPIIAGIVLVTQISTILLSQAGVVFLNLPQVAASSGGGAPIFSSPKELPPLLVFLQSMDPVLVAFILFSWMPYARIMNTSVLQLRHTEYIEAAQAVGVRPFWIIFRHLLPNAIGPAIVLTAKDIGNVVLMQAMFTFIGLGGDSPWGMILVQGRGWIISPGGIFTYWWVFIPATLAIILFGIGWNLIGDGINDARNPRFGTNIQY